MANSRTIERGVLLLDQLAQAESSISGCVESDKRTAALKEIKQLRNGIRNGLFKTPSGMAHYAFSQVVSNGKLIFPDLTEVHNHKRLTSLVERYGWPDEAAHKLTDEVAVEMVSAAFEDDLAAQYVVEVCRDRLIRGVDLPYWLRVFAGLSLQIPQAKKPRGRTKHVNEVRNKMIAGVARVLQQSFDLPLSRGIGSEREAVCSVIRDALAHYGLNMTEEAIRKVVEGTQLLNEDASDGGK